MPFKKTAGKVPLVGTWGKWNWEHGLTPEAARLRAIKDPSTKAFFHCREATKIDQFNFVANDVVFFDAEPKFWPGQLPIDTYQKLHTTVGYFDSRDVPLRNIANFELKNGGYTQPFFDMAVLFAANIKDPENPDTAHLDIGGYIARTLDETDDVLYLQKRGISVLLGVLPDHDQGGWTCFTDDKEGEKGASAFAKQLADAIDKYGLDGIDIDIEYHRCTSQLTSLAMVTSALRQLKPNTIISKALWDNRTHPPDYPPDWPDTKYLTAAWHGRTLAEQLTYGWEMSYYDTDVASRLEQYAQAGVEKRRLHCGVYNIPDDPGNTTPEWAVKPLAEGVRDQGYAGMMVFGCQNFKLANDYVQKIATVLFNGKT